MMAKLKSLIKRVAVTSEQSDAGAIHKAQVTYMGRVQDSQVFHDYGFCSSVPSGGIGICLSPRGEESDRVSFVCHPKYRGKDLKPGETIVGNFVVEATLFFDEDGKGILTLPDNLEITCKNLTANVSGDAKLTAKSWEINGPVKMNDGLNVSGEMKNNGTDVGSGHNHHSGAYKDSDGGNVTGKSGDPV